MKRLVFQSFPNNEVRWGFDDLPYPREKKQDSHEDIRREMEGSLHDRRRLSYLSDNNITEYRDSYGTLWRTSEGSVHAVRSEDGRNLVITHEVQESRKNSLGLQDPRFNKPIVRTRFTRNARHRLLEAGALCERERARGRLGVFVTFTLPGSRYSGYHALARYSGYVCNRICQVLRDDKRDVSYFWVWERQRRGALHLHLFVLIPQGEEWNCYRESLRAAWYNSLHALDESGQGDMFGHKDGEYCTASSFWRYDYQLVNKGVANYLSKYVSKNAERGFSSEPDEHDQGIYPRRWWYMSRDLTRKINEQRKVIACEAISDEDIVVAMSAMNSMVADMQPVLRHSFNADIGRKAGRDGSFGSTYREIAWFDSFEFADIELALRSEFIRVIASMQKTRVTFKGFALDYGGERLTPFP